MLSSNEIAKEIDSLLKTMFPSSDQRSNHPDSTWMRVNRLMLLSQKMSMAIQLEWNTEEVAIIEGALKNYERGES